MEEEHGAGVAQGAGAGPDAETVYVVLERVNPFLVCHICDGYFREAYTIQECLHSFCKSCLWQRFASGSQCCPRCGTSLGPSPRSAAMFDRTLQGLVDKVVPHLAQQDDEAEARFYKERGIKLKSEVAAQAKSSSTQSKKLDPTTTIHFRVVQAEPHEGNPRLPELAKASLKTDKRLRVDQLRRFLGRRLSIKGVPLEILCRDQVLGSEHTMEYISKTMWDADSGALTLHYRQAK